MTDRLTAVRDEVGKVTERFRGEDEAVEQSSRDATHEPDFDSLNKLFDDD